MQARTKSASNQSTHSTRPKNDICAIGVLERPRYFPRQLITPDILTLEADYFRKRLRLHNRHLHGWGVVCGAAVCPVKDPDDPNKSWAWHVKITPGYILGPYGDDIVIDREHVVDLRATGAIRVAGEYYGESYDPWCTEVITDDLPDIIYVAVRYHEVKARQVRVQPAGCGCDDLQCEYSRWQDGYQVGILTECPPSHQREKSDPGSWGDCFPTGEGEEGEEDAGRRYPKWPSCLPCPTSPWVVLAQVTLDASGLIGAEDIDNNKCRRVVTCSAYFCPDLYAGVGPDLTQAADTKFREYLVAYREALKEQQEQIRELQRELQALRQGLAAEDTSEVTIADWSQPVERRTISAEDRIKLREYMGAEELLTQHIIGELDWDSPSIGEDILRLPVHALHGLGAGSLLGTWLTDKTIGDVAAMTYEEIRPSVVEEEIDNVRLSNQFKQIVQKASRITTLISRMQNRW